MRELLLVYVFCFLSQDLFSRDTTCYYKNVIAFPDTINYREVTSSNVDNSQLKPKDWIPAAIGAIISLIVLSGTIYMGSLTLRRTKEVAQMNFNAQLETTVKKEWRHNFRTYLSTNIYQLENIGKVQLVIAKVTKDTVDLPPYKDILLQFQQSKSSLRLLLGREKSQQDVLLLIQDAYKQAKAVQTVADYDTLLLAIEKIVDAAHLLLKED